MEVMLENRQEVMRHSVISRNISLDGFDRQVLVGVRRAGKSYILYGHIQKLIAAGHSWDEIIYLNFEDERIAGMELSDLNIILEVHARLSENVPCCFLMKYKMSRDGKNSRVELPITNIRQLSQEVTQRCFLWMWLRHSEAGI